MYEYTDEVWDFWDQLLYGFNPTYGYHLKTTRRLDNLGLDIYGVFDYEDGCEILTFQLKLKETQRNEKLTKLRNYTVNLSYVNEKGNLCAFGKYFDRKTFSHLAFGFPLVGFGIIFTYEAFRQFWNNFEPQLNQIKTGSDGVSEYYQVALAEIVHGMTKDKDYFVITNLPIVTGDLRK